LTDGGVRTASSNPRKFLYFSLFSKPVSAIIFDAGHSQEQKGKPMINFPITTLLGLLSIGFAGMAMAEPTEVTVHVIAEDAKFVGDHMGGASITLRDAKTGKILAQGLTKGGTGDTKRIMESGGRSPLRATPDAAFFTSIIDIREPTLVTLEAEGPVGHPGSTLHVMSERWIMPGHPVTTGDGWTIELPGLAISLSTSVAGRTVAITSKIEPMCGCPITPGGIWDAADYKVEASAWQNGRQIALAPLNFVKAPGGFAGDITIPESGKYKIVIFAHNEKTGNSGLTEAVVEVP
jgi:hypothetical protein